MNIFKYWWIRLFWKPQTDPVHVSNEGNKLVHWYNNGGAAWNGMRRASELGYKTGVAGNAGGCMHSVVFSNDEF